jgi:predicted DNA-binding transcriptional regulator YafY
VTIEMQFGSEAEAVSALLGLGDRVEVLAPPSVRTQVVETAVRVARRYGVDRPSGQRVDQLG